MFLLQTLLQYCISSWEISCHISKTIDEPKKINEKSTLGIFGTKAKDIKFSLWGSFYSGIYTEPLRFIFLLSCVNQLPNMKIVKAFMLHQSSLTTSPPLPPQVCLAAWTSMKPVSTRTMWTRNGRGLCPLTPTPDPPLPPVARTFRWVAQHIALANNLLT